MTELKVDVTTDRYPSETSFEVRDKSNGVVVESKNDFTALESTWSGTFCMSDGEYEFEIKDR